MTVKNMIIIPARKVLKLQLSFLDDVQRLQTAGVLSGYTKIPPYNINDEMYYDLQQCFSCYKYGHRIGSCRSAQGCSKCAATGHFHTDCTGGVTNGEL